MEEQQKKNNFSPEGLTSGKSRIVSEIKSFRITMRRKSRFATRARITAYHLWFALAKLISHHVFFAFTQRIPYSL